jgi:electron transport complex protein RnfC
MNTSFTQIIQKLDSDELWDFPGGVYPAGRKSLSNQVPIAALPIPQYVYITVKQHIGVSGQLIVEEGQLVKKGQALTKSMNPFAVPVHAPTSGQVVAIEPHVTAHPSGLPELTIKIETDQEDSWQALVPLNDYQNQDKAQVLAAICEAGISGMGGAGFPTHIKSAPQKEVEFLIINGIECEPYITSDDRLMREHAWQIRQGIDVLTHLLSPKQVLIGVENNKPEAIEAMQIACRENPLYRVCVVPTKYPAGGEKQLIQVLTNREVPAKLLPIDIGVIMYNVGTCFAIADAIFSGKPLLQRVVTVTGEAVNKPANYWTLIGTPIAHLLQHSQYIKTTQRQPNVIMGGPMMGFSVANDLVPVVKTTNCILVPTDNEMADNHEQACIRCGACADVCPASLLPQQMFWHAKAKELDKAQDYNLFDCIECGACAFVCPSEIPLVHYYRVAKAEIKTEQDDKQKSDKARERFETRASRLLADQQARDEKHRLAAEARKQAMSSTGNDAKGKIAAALARAKAKKQAAANSQTSTSQDEPQVQTPEQSQSTAAETVRAASPNTRVQDAIARAKAKRAAAEKVSHTLEKNGTDTDNTQNTESVASTDINTDINTDTDNTQNAGSVASTENALGIVNTENAENTAAHLLVPEPVSINQVGTEQPMADLVAHAPTAPATAKTKAPQDLEKTAVLTQAATEKQQQIATAVAKAKAKRQAKQVAGQAALGQPSDTTQPTPVALDQALEIKKRRIAAAVAKAKAKKAAAIAAQNSTDSKEENKR